MVRIRCQLFSPNKSRVSYYQVQRKELHKKLSDWCYVKSSDHFHVYLYRNANDTIGQELFDEIIVRHFTLPLHIFYQLPQQFVLLEPIGLPKQPPCHLPCLTYFQVLCVSYLNFSINNIKRKNGGRKMFMTNNKTKLHNPISYFVSWILIVYKSRF